VGNQASLGRLVPATWPRMCRWHDANPRVFQLPPARVHGTAALHVFQNAGLTSDEKRRSARFVYYRSDLSRFDCKDTNDDIRNTGRTRWPRLLLLTRRLGPGWSPTLSKPKANDVASGLSDRPRRRQTISSLSSVDDVPQCAGGCTSFSSKSKVVTVGIGPTFGPDSNSFNFNGLIWLIR
jgi:hypothetical protein